MVELPLIAQLFVLVNPFSSPLTVLVAARERGLPMKRLAVGAVLTAYFVAIAIALVGPPMLKLFGISVDSFRIAGGIVLLLLGIEIVRSHEEPALGVEGMDSLMAVLATPMLTGPATMTYITLKAHEMDLPKLLLNVTITFAGVLLVVLFLAVAIEWLNLRLMSIIRRVLGLFLTAVGIQMIAQGLTVLLAPVQRAAGA